MSAQGLRVLTLSSYLPGVGGGELQTALQMRTLKALGHQIEVFDLAPKKGAARNEDVDGIPVTRPRSSRVPLWRGIALHIDLARWLLPRLRNADVVHFNHLGPPLFPVAAACRWRRVPLVLVIWGSSRPGVGPFGAGLKRGLVRWLARRQRAVVALGASNAETLAGAGFARETLHVIPNGVDTERFRPSEDRAALRADLGLQSGPVAVTVGRLVPAKGYEVLIQAWAAVRDALPEARLVIVGEGVLRQALEEQVAELGLQGHVRLAGLRRDVPRWLAAADIYVSSSRTEGMSNAILEALASGLPVVATRVGAAPDVVRHGESGLLVRPEDAADLSRAILEILGHPGVLGRMSREARRQALSEFGIEAVARQYADLYRFSVRRRS